jgi:hypothetical protein
MKSPIVKYLLAMLLVTAALELFVRANSENFFALSDKLLLKVEILKRSPDTRVLCLGTSRFLDAIDERRFSAEIERLSRKRIKVMNAATTGSQGARFEYFAEIAAGNPHLTHVILEATPPALQDGELNFPDSITTRTSSVAGTPIFTDKVENRLQKWVVENIALAKYRKALRPATVEKFFVLQTADWIPPNSWSRKGILRNFFTTQDFEITAKMINGLRPEIIDSADAEPPRTDLRSDVAFDHLSRVAEIFSASDIEVIWVSPPVSAAKSHSNHNGKYSDFYRQVALHHDSVFYDYAETPLDDAYLRDPTHLNAAGRHLFTTILARDLADRIADESK